MAFHCTNCKFCTLFVLFCYSFIIKQYVFIIIHEDISVILHSKLCLNYFLNILINIVVSATKFVKTRRLLEHWKY